MTFITAQHIYQQKKGYGYKDITKFMVCPKCKALPRVWTFDNGNFAKCVCSGIYDSGVKAEDIMTHCRNNNSSLLNYNGDKDLIENWNIHINSLKEDITNV